MLKGGMVLLLIWRVLVAATRVMLVCRLLLTRRLVLAVVVLLLPG